MSSEGRVASVVSLLADARRSQSCCELQLHCCIDAGSGFGPAANPLKTNAVEYL